MSKVGVASVRQQERHTKFVASLRIGHRHAIAARYSDGGAGRRRHRSRRIGGRSA